MTILDERIENYTKMINEEANPVLKMLYELNRDLLSTLKRDKCQNDGLSSSMSSETKEGVE